MLFVQKGLLLTFYMTMSPLQNNKKKHTQTYPIHAANSKVLGTVADNKIIPTCDGNIIKTSSHTTPLYEMIKIVTI